MTSTQFPDECDLVRSIARGDAAAFEKALIAYQDRVYRYTYNFVREEDRARDIAQETFLRLWRNAPSLQPSQPLIAWLYSVARNLSLNEARRFESRNVTALSDELSAQLGSHQDTQNIASLLRAEELAHLRSVIATLEPEERELIYLRFFEELPHEQIASLLKVKPAACRQRISRVVSKLRDLLTK